MCTRARDCVCVVLSRTLAESILHEVMDAVTTGRVLWSWLELLWCLGGTEMQRLHLNVSILNVTLTLTDSGGRIHQRHVVKVTAVRVHNYSQLHVVLAIKVQKYYQHHS